MPYSGTWACNAINRQNYLLHATKVHGESANSCIHYCLWQWMKVLSQLQAPATLSLVEEPLIPAEKKAG